MRNLQATACGGLFSVKLILRPAQKYVMTSNHPEDFILAQRIAAGEEQAASEVFRTLAGELYGFALKMVGDANSAEDVLQETMLGFLQSMHRYDAQVSLRTWAFAILRHKITDIYRQRGREILISTDDPERDSFLQNGRWREAPTGVWDENAELLAIVKHCMEALPLQQREALELRAIQGLSTQEAAEILGVSPENLRQILHRGRASVRKCTDAKYGDVA